MYHYTINSRYIYQIGKFGLCFDTRPCEINDLVVSSRQVLVLIVSSDGNWSEKEICLPFLLSVAAGMFVLTKSCISSMCEFIMFICSMKLDIAPRIRSVYGAVSHGA